MAGAGAGPPAHRRPAFPSSDISPGSVTQPRDKDHRNQGSHRSGRARLRRRPHARSRRSSGSSRSRGQVLADGSRNSPQYDGIRALALADFSPGPHRRAFMVDHHLVHEQSGCCGALGGAWLLKVVIAHHPVIQAMAGSHPGCLFQFLSHSPSSEVGTPGRLWSWWPVQWPLRSVMRSSQSWMDAACAPDCSIGSPAAFHSGKPSSSLAARRPSSVASRTAWSAYRQYGPRQ